MRVGTAKRRVTPSCRTQLVREACAMARRGALRMWYSEARRPSHASRSGVPVQISRGSKARRTAHHTTARRVHTIRWRGSLWCRPSTTPQTRLRPLTAAQRASVPQELEDDPGQLRRHLLSWMSTVTASRSRSAKAWHPACSWAQIGSGQGVSLRRHGVAHAATIRQQALRTGRSQAMACSGASGSLLQGLRH